MAFENSKEEEPSDRNEHDWPGLERVVELKDVVDSNVDVVDDDNCFVSSNLNETNSRLSC